MPHADEKHRAPLLWLLAPFIAGLVFACLTSPRSGVWLLALAAMAAVATIIVSRRELRHRQVLWTALLASAACLAGMTRMHEVLDPGGVGQRRSGLPAREATLEIEVTRLFPASADGQRQSGIATVVRATAPLAEIRGQRIYFAVDEATPLVRTQRVELRGVLRSLNPQVIAPGGFDAYLVNAGIRLRLERAAVIATTRPPTKLARFFATVGARCESILRRGLPADHPAGGVYLAMFLGRKSELSDAQKESFMRSGTMHLFAISGLHIAVIAGCLHTLLSVVRMPPRIGAVLGLIALWIFVEATGGTPSARRALLMVAFIWAGSALRRPANPVASLVTSAFAVLLWDPLALLSTSFQLSYAVVAALLLYGLPLRNRWQARWNPWRDRPEADWRWWHWVMFKTGRGVCTAAAISWSATLISTPLSLAYFGLASPGAVLSNLALVPVTSGAIAAGVASLVCGFVGITSLSTLFNHAGALILALVETGARLAADIPGMFFHGGFAHAWMAPMVVFALLCCFVAGYAHGWDRFPGRWFTPPAVLVALLVFLVTPGRGGQESAGMKSAYELAMERLRQSDPEAAPQLTAEQKARLAEIDRVYQGKIAEREIFLKQRLAEAQTANQPEEAEKILAQIKSERARLEEEREDEKNRVRRAAGEKKS